MAKRHLTPAQVFKTPVWSQFKHFLGLYTGHDSNMADAWSIGLELCSCHYHTLEQLSDATWSIRDDVELVERNVLGPIMRGADAEQTFRSARELLGSKDDHMAGASLRRWSGCMDAAKVIAIGTRSGRNWPWWRRRLSRFVHARSRNDSFYASGVLAAVAFKMGRDEPYSFFGIPAGNIIRQGIVAKLGRLPVEEPDSHVMEP